MKKRLFIVISPGLFGTLILTRIIDGSFRLPVQLLAVYLTAWSLFFVYSARPFRKKIHVFLLANLSPLFLVGCFELAALVKLLDYRIVFSTPVYDPIRNPRYRYDPELVFIRRPHQHLKGTVSGGTMTWLYQIPSTQLYSYDHRYDQHGFRNEVDLTSADIAVMGDSFIEGTLVSSPELMTSRLARLQGSVVSNMGQIGYGPQQELIVLKRYVLPLNPYTVIWAFFEGNDLKNVLEYQRLIRNRVHLSRFHSFEYRSFTRNARLALLRLWGIKRNLPSGLSLSGLFSSADGNVVRVYFLYPGKDLSPNQLKALAKARNSFAAGYRMCAERGVRMIVIFIPNKFRVYKNACRFEPQSECSSWVLNDLPGRFKAMISGISDQIGYVDLTPALTGAAMKGSMVHFGDDEHWSPEGHRIVAEVVNDFIPKDRALN